MDRGPSANHTRNVGSSNVDSSQRLLRLPRFQQHLHNGEEVRDQRSLTRDRFPTLESSEILLNSLSLAFTFQWKIKAVVYQNSSIIAVSAVVFSFLAGMVYTSKFRKKIIMRKNRSFAND